tara:strand:+ start:33 stop:2063 length:2031 start_codon:yes stop_codon:yes gene_type:complete
MKIFKYFLPIIFTCFIGNLSAQEDATIEADGAFSNEAYFSAVSLYKKAYSKEHDRTHKIAIIYKIARSYHMVQDFAQAEVWYDKAIKAKHPDKDVQLYFAEVIQAQGKYDEALAQYNKFNAKNPNDERGLEGAKWCKIGQEWDNNPTDYEIENVKLLNSKNMDFAPTWGSKKHDEMIFSSTRDGSFGNSIDTRTGDSYSDLYSAKIDRKGKWSSPTAIKEPVNSEVNEGTATFNAKFSTMYFTRCPDEKNTVLGCYLMSTTRRGKEWDEPVKLEFAPDSIVVGHPAMLPDGITMVFVSNMEGTYGGEDLWFATYDKKAKTWSAPENLGSGINTSGDELYPYIRDNGDLYFSTSARKGMGGLDIYSAEKTGKNKWGNIQNIKAPINSYSDDFGILFDGNKDKGFFSSNRPGGRGSDDIYTFKKPPIIYVLQGTIKDVETKEKISNATIKLIGTDGASVELKSDQTGFYIFAEMDGVNRYINENTSYTIFVSKEGYLNSKGQETTVGVLKSTAFVHDFVLQSIKADEITFPKVEYDLAKWNLREQSKDSLDFLYQTLFDNPQITIELSAHTDARGGDDANMTLSQKRAQSCVDYLVQRGVEAERMTAAGYGEGQPYHGNFNGQVVTVNEEYINGLDASLKEAAHQINRRTVFKVLTDDYVSNKTAAPTDGSGDVEEGE